MPEPCVRPLGGYTCTRPEHDRETWCRDVTNRGTWILSAAAWDNIKEAS